MIVCGHTRYKAALKLGLTEVPVHVAADLTPEQCRAYRLADNKTGSLAEFDFDLLPAEIMDLSTGDIDLTDFGWTADELLNIVHPDGIPGLTDPDEIPEAPEPVTKPGDLWVLGEHRLLCGDSTKAEDVERLMAGEKAVLAPPAEEP